MPDLAFVTRVPRVVSGRVRMVPTPRGWMGVIVQDQAQADERIPYLLRTPAAVRFLSVEPLLGPVDLSRWVSGLDVSYAEDGTDLGSASGGSDLDWVIVGGESGPGSRPMHPDWVRSIRDQCLAAGVPFCFLGWGEWAFDCKPTDADEVVRSCLENPRGRWVGPNGERTHTGWDTVHMIRIGKRAAGRLLDGRTWDETPDFATEAR